MGNSKLVTYTKLSPNCNKPRDHAIDTITIHCFVAQVTAEQGCNIDKFTKKNGSSCNYVVGYDGSIGLCVDEANRSWCSGGKDILGREIKVNGISGKDNDHRAITIEVASDNKAPYAVTDKAYNALIELVADICKRNNIKKLMWKADKKLVGNVGQQNMTVHRWFSTKACPGEYLYNRLGDIAEKVNKLIGVVEEEKTPASVSAVSKGDAVSIVDGATYYNGKSIPAWVKKKQWIIAEVEGDRAVLGKSADGKNNIQSAINIKHITVVAAAKKEEAKVDAFVPYKVKVIKPPLNIRSGPGTNYPVVGVIKETGVYTIVEEAKGNTQYMWGKLKSNAGWCSMSPSFVKKV